MELIATDIKITSLQIADRFNIEHKTVLKKIRRILAGAEISPATFSNTYIDEQNKERPMMILPKRETLLVATKFDDKLRLQLVDMVLELEHTKSVNIPKEFIDRLKDAEKFLPKEGTFQKVSRNGLAKIKERRGAYVADPRDPLVIAESKIRLLETVADGLIDLTEDINSAYAELERVRVKALEG